MAKSVNVAAPLFAALCFATLLSLPSSADSIHVEGKVYCDPCRVGFVTALSQGLKDATVRLECRFRQNSTVTFAVEGTTDNWGMYRLPVQGEHEEEICAVQLVKSRDGDCSEPFQKDDRARVLLTTNVGVVQPARFANPLGFMKKVADSDCGRVLESMGFLPLVV